MIPLTGAQLHSSKSNKGLNFPPWITYVAATPGMGLGMPPSALENGRGGGVSPPLPIRLLPSRNGIGGGNFWEGRRASVFAGAHCAGTYYMGQPGSRRGSCGLVGPPASGQRATAIADHGPLTEAEWTRCGWGLLSGSVVGLRACWVRPRSSPFPALKRACTLVGVWRLKVP